VLRKREDGYHDINTVFYRLHCPSDTITVSPSDRYELKVVNADLPADSSNLITKAFEKCAAVSQTSLPNIRVELQKCVPYGAGLGGGSANAAKAIEIFSETVSRLSNEQKCLIASELGADVAFFLQSASAAIASGKGDILTPVSLVLPYYFLIVKPKGISISTAEAYRRISIPKREPTDLARIIESPLPLWKNSIVNDFEAVAFAMYPELSDLKQRLYESGAGFALMSGSGSAFFGVYLEEGIAEKALRKFEADPKVEVFLST